MSGENLSVTQRAHRWIVGPDTGVSSIAIWSLMMGVPAPESCSPPLDPNDLGRCLRLLDTIPEWRPDLGKLAEIPRWRPIIDNWAQLEALYREELAEDTGEAPRLYARMSELL